MLKKILSIAGKPGLYRLVSRGNGNLIVETLDSDKRRMPAFASNRITSLGDIAIYTDDEDTPLYKVLVSVGELENLRPASIDYKKATGDELRDYLAKALPNFDRERVHASDIKKLIQWYNLLIEAGITDFAKDMAGEEEAES